MKFLIDEKVKALVFDCDGTLVDSMPLHMKAWEEAFRHFNTYFDYDFLYSLKGMKEIEIIELYNKTFKTNLIPKGIVSAKHKYFSNNIHTLTPIEKIVEVVRNNHNKLPMAVVSGSIGKIVHKELMVIGIHDFFKVILTADDPFKPKPAPDIFLAAAGILNVHPGDCLVFEDGDPGLEAAANAGMQSIDVRLYL